MRLGAPSAPLLPASSPGSVKSIRQTSRSSTRQGQYLARPELIFLKRNPASYHELSSLCFVDTQYVNNRLPSSAHI